jgi:hypothetical protein
LSRGADFRTEKMPQKNAAVRDPPLLPQPRDGLIYFRKRYEAIWMWVVPSRSDSVYST